MSDDHRPLLTTSSPRGPHFTIPATYCAFHQQGTLLITLDCWIGFTIEALFKMIYRARGTILLFVWKRQFLFFPFEVLKKFDLSIPGVISIVKMEIRPWELDRQQMKSSKSFEKVKKLLFPLTSASETHHLKIRSHISRMSSNQNHRSSLKEH